MVMSLYAMFKMQKIFQEMSVKIKIGRQFIYDFSKYLITSCQILSLSGTYSHSCLNKCVTPKRTQISAPHEDSCLTLDYVGAESSLAILFSSNRQSQTTNQFRRNCRFKARASRSYLNSMLYYPES